MQKSFAVTKVSSFKDRFTLSGLVTVMVSMVTCGAPILPTAGSLKQKTCKQNVILNTKY